MAFQLSGGKVNWGSTGAGPIGGVPQTHTGIGVVIKVLAKNLHVYYVPHSTVFKH